ncbi:Hypothetical protein SMAX5B_021834 [Scophthalmus maximus]|uniref:Uncharacterized protein n=1 Tax=Scophthalmus maximus TaxID=52904 RepID=A0A2U9BIC2_SCOMX|nr:Hypothetical protein SMAX5B_021834 [Scophthalmus maximus]
MAWHQRMDFSQTLLLILTLDYYLPTPAKLLIGQLPAEAGRADAIKDEEGKMGRCSEGGLRGIIDF